MSGLHSLLPFTLYKHQSHFVFCFKGSNYLSCNLLVTVQCRNNSRAVYFSHFSVQAKQSDLTCCCLNSYMQLVNITAILACQFITLQRNTLLHQSMLFNLLKQLRYLGTCFVAFEKFVFTVFVVSQVRSTPLTLSLYPFQL